MPNWNMLENGGLSLCIQGTPNDSHQQVRGIRFIPVYTGNSIILVAFFIALTVYPCVYRELIMSTLKGSF